MGKKYNKDVDKKVVVLDNYLFIDDYIKNSSIRKIIIFEEWLDEDNKEVDQKLKEWAKKQINDKIWKKRKRRTDGIKTWIELGK